MLKGLRSIKKAPNVSDAFKKLSANNALMKNFADVTTVSKNAVGSLRFDSFTQMMRQGRITEALGASNKAFSSISDSNTYVKSLKREASVLPDGDLLRRNTTIANIGENIPSLRNVTNAQELEALATSNVRLRNLLEDLDAKAVKNGSGTTKKLLILGGAIAFTGAIYAVLADTAAKSSGCFLFTKNADGSVTKCKIANASCKNPQAGNSGLCAGEILPPYFTVNRCKDWPKDGPECFACNVNAKEGSPEYLDASELGENQTVECITSSILDVIGDAANSVGSWIGQGAGDLSASASGILKYLVWGVIILVIIFVAWKFGGKFFSSMAKDDISKTVRTATQAVYNVDNHVKEAGVQAQALINTAAAVSTSALENINKNASETAIATQNLAATQNKFLIDSANMFKREDDIRRILPEIKNYIDTGLQNLQYGNLMSALGELRGRNQNVCVLPKTIISNGTPAKTMTLEEVL